jgi:hypothetical protein
MLTWLQYVRCFPSTIASCSRIRSWNPVLVCEQYQFNSDRCPEIPAQAIYLTLFYTKREYALRIGYLFVSAAIAGSLGGIFAYG